MSRTETTISENEWNSIVDAVKSSNFMGLPGELPEVEADDGSTCYIEVKTSAGDHNSASIMMLKLVAGCCSSVTTLRR